MSLRECMSPERGLLKIQSRNNAPAPEWRRSYAVRATPERHTRLPLATTRGRCRGARRGLLFLQTAGKRTGVLRPRDKYARDTFRPGHISPVSISRII